MNGVLDRDEAEERVRGRKQPAAPTPEGLAIGRRIRQLRRDLGMEQKELAIRAHVDQSTLSRIERGITTEMGGTKSVEIARVLGSTAEYVMTGRPPEATLARTLYNDAEIAHVKYLLDEAKRLSAEEAEIEAHRVEEPNEDEPR